ncbi:hypothetical protein HJ158_24905 [Vibrio parahaemolyticus]|nr:hypothetical protein [Vibrio parahaemolyticus]
MTIKLVNIYTHRYGSTGIEKSCTVYNNGIMRLVVWAEVQYQDVSESDVFSDVQKNLTIYHGQAGDMSAWTHKGGEAGPYNHDVASLEEKEILPSKNNNKGYILTRVPVYFTVPTTATTTSVLASYGGVSISQAEAINVNVISFEPSGFKLKIEDTGNHYDGANLRKLYIDFPTNHHLTHWEPLGVIFTHEPPVPGYYRPVMSMIHSWPGHKGGVFLMPEGTGFDGIHEVAYAPDYSYVRGGDVPQTSETGDARNEVMGGYHVYGNSNFPANHAATVYTGTTSGTWMDTRGLDVKVVKQIYLDGGIPMVKLAKKKLEMQRCEYVNYGCVELSFEDAVHTLTDNFGNKMKITIDWDVGDWWGIWGVTKVEKA